MSHRTSPMMKRRGEEGASLIEVAVGVIVVALLAAVIVYVVGRDDGEDAPARVADIEGIKAAQQEFCKEVGTYGTEDQLAGRAPAPDGKTYQFLTDPSPHLGLAFIGGGACGRDPLTSGYLITGDPATMAPGGGGPFVVGAGALQPSTLLNPAVTTQGGIQSQSAMLFNGLVAIGPNAAPIPELAESWTISPDGKTYTFSLRKDVLWSDSTPLPNPTRRVTAEDVKFSYEAALLLYHARTSSSIPGALATPCTDPASGTATPRRLSCPSIIADDNASPATVRFVFADTFGPLLQQATVTDGAIIPAHIWPACASGATGACPTPTAAWPAGQPPVGTGPFRFKSESATELVYEKNPNFWKPGIPYFNEVKQIVTTGLPALQAGTIDYTGLGTVADVDAAKGDPKVVVDTGTMAPGGSTNCTQTVMFNLWERMQPPAAIRNGTATPHPQLGDKAPTPMIDPDGSGPEPAQPRGRLVRRAIAMSLEREPNVSGSNPGYVALSGSPGASLAQGPTNSGMPVGATPAPLPAYDKAKAESFLDAAGFPDTNGAEAGGRFSLGLSNFATAALGTAMQENMGKVGIEVGFNPGQTSLTPPFPQTVPLFGQRNFDILIVSSCQNTDPEMGTRRVYHTDAINGQSFTNGSGYSNPTTIDVWFNDGRKSLDPAVRTAAYKKINDQVAIDLPTLYLLETVSNRAYSTSCLGLRPYTGHFPEYGSCRRNA